MRGSFFLSLWLSGGGVTKFVSSISTLFTLWQLRFTTNKGFTRAVDVGSKIRLLMSPGRELSWWRDLPRLIDLAWWLFIVYTKLDFYPIRGDGKFILFEKRARFQLLVIEKRAIVCLAMAQHKIFSLPFGCVLWNFRFLFSFFSLQPEIFSCFFAIQPSAHTHIHWREFSMFFDARSSCWVGENC
jgi:hypothetical protein